MSNVPEQLLYAESHEWIKEEGDGTITVGITDHAQDLLGDLVYIDMPDVGKTTNAGEEVAVVESVKAAADLYSPVDGEVVKVNDALADAPELVNTDPYGEGWILKLRPSESISADAFLDARAYAALADSESEQCSEPVMP